MAEVAISGLPAVVTPQDTDEIPVNQGGITKKATRAQLGASKANTVHTHAISDVTNLQATLDGKIDAPGSPTSAAGQVAFFIDANSIEGRTAADTRAALDLEPGTDFLSFADATTQAFTSTSGSQAAAQSGKSWKTTANLTNIPVTNGWVAKYVNTSGGSVTITPASGNCIKTIDGTTAASVTLGNNKSCVVHADGTNLVVDGGVT